MKNKYILAWKNKIALTLAGIRNSREEGSHLIEILGAIIVAILLLGLFKTKIGEMFKSVLNTSNTKLQALFS